MTTHLGSEILSNASGEVCKVQTTFGYRSNLRLEKYDDFFVKFVDVTLEDKQATVLIKRDEVKSIEYE